MFSSLLVSEGKGFVCLHEVRGQPRFETGSLYHFMFVEKGVWHPETGQEAFMVSQLLGETP